MLTTPGAPRPRAALGWALLATAGVLLAQFLTVRYNSQGDWSALFHEGALYPAAPQLEWEHHRRLPDSLGYDGQIYHLVAHDPFMRGELMRHVDAPRLRYRRILVPLLAYVAVLGRQDLIDVAYRGVVLLFVFLGTYWCGIHAALLGRGAAWGLAFVSIPAVIVSADSMTVDVALAALTAGFALYCRRENQGKLLGVLATAALVRETGVLLAVAEGLGLAARKRVRVALLTVVSLLPTVGWYLYVHARTTAYEYPNSFVPLRGMARAFLDPAAVPVIAAGQVAAWWRFAIMQRPQLDRLALLGALASFVLAFLWLRARPTSRLAAAAALWALLGVFVQRPDNWLHVYDYGRVYSPLLLLLALRGIEERSPWQFLPLALMWPRLALELTMPVVGVLRGLVRGVGA